MIRSPLIFYLLCAAATLLSIVRYVRVSAPLPARLLLITVRTVALVLILCAFIEPTLVFERLSSGNTPVPVLIDCSRSMNIVTTDSAIVNSIKKLQRYHGLDKKQIQFAWYGFGDSLRRLKEPLALKFNDRRSYFPSSPDDKILQRAHEVIMISDGNWSNMSPGRDFFYEKSVYFLPLPGAHPRPSLTLTVAHPEVVTVSVDSAAKIATELDGRLGKRGTVSVTVHETGRLLVRREISVDSGFFRDTVVLPVPSGVPGVIFTE